MIVERTNAMAVAFSPIDNMENFAIPFYHANQKLKAYLSDPTSNASVMRKMVELVDEQMFAPAYPSVLGRKVENIRYKVGSLIYMAKNSITMEDMMWKLNGADLEALYSLHLESRNEAPFSERSLKYFLSACTVYYYRTVPLLPQIQMLTHRYFDGGYLRWNFHMKVPPRLLFSLPDEA